MRALVVTVLLACLAVGAWFVFTRTEVQAPPAASVSAVVSDDPAAAPATAPAPTATPEPPGSRTAVDADAQKRQAAPTQFSGPVGEVQVVRHPGQEPIADATVYFLPPDFDWSKMGRELQELARTDNEAFQKRVSLALTTDAAGRCRVPLGRYGTGVTAVKDALWGQAHLTQDATGPTVLALRPDRTLRVLVVGAGGSPERGARVLGKRKDGDQPMTWQIGLTDATGRHEQRHVQQFAGKEGDAKIEFAAGIPGGEGPAVLVDVTAPPPEVVLHLPPGGTVTVQVRDAAGQPIDPAFLGDAMVRLATFGERPTSSQAESQGLNSSQGGVPLDERGVAVFGTVALGRFVMAHLNFSLRSSVVPGPTAENPRVELTLTEGADDVVLTGTLLDAGSRPLVSSVYQAICTYKNGMGSQQGRTDGAGRFRIAMGAARAGPVTLGFDTKVANTDNPLAVELPPRELAKGRNDLGEVRLLAHAVLVQGKVTGHPAGDPPPVGLQIERQRDGRWQQEHNLRPVWEASGAFTIRSGMAKGTPIRLLVQTNEFLPVAPIECAAGDTGIEIKLNKGGSARATFLVDDSLPIERLTFRFRPTDPSPQRDPRAEMMDRMYGFPGQNQAKDGRLQRDWQGLKPGRYRLQALCAGIAEPLVAIDAIEIADGPCADPRLVDIDLRGRVRAFEVRAVGSDGKAIVSQDAFVVIRSQGDEWCGFQLATGVVKIAAPAAVDLIVLAKGHKAAFVNGVSDSRTVTLEAAGEARIALELPSPLPAGAELKLRLKPAIEVSRRARLQLDNGSSNMVENFFVEDAVVDTAGKATVPVRYPGSYTVEATVSLGRRGGSYIREFEPGTITLPAAGEVVVRMGQKGLDRALEGQRR